MSEKTSKMLRQMRMNNTKGKRYWNSLPHTERGKIRAAFLNNPKLGPINFLAQHEAGLLK